MTVHKYLHKILYKYFVDNQRDSPTQVLSILSLSTLRCERLCLSLIYQPHQWEPAKALHICTFYRVGVVGGRKGAYRGWKEGVCIVGGRKEGVQWVVTFHYFGKWAAVGSYLIFPPSIRLLFPSLVRKSCYCINIYVLDPHARSFLF